MQPIGDISLGKGHKSHKSLACPGFSSEKSGPGEKKSPSEIQKEEDEMQIVRTSKQNCTQRPVTTPAAIGDAIAWLARFHGCTPATIRRQLLAGEAIETNLSFYHATDISDIPAESVPTGLDAESEN
jgi:hypothetical protein